MSLALIIMKIFTEIERSILKKFIKPSVVREGDENTLNRWASIGFVGYKFDWDTMEEIAYLTEEGIAHINR